jgi:hypothetical protein
MGFERRQVAGQLEGLVKPAFAQAGGCEGHGNDELGCV